MGAVIAFRGRPGHSAADVGAALRAVGFEVGEPAGSNVAVLDTFDGRIAAAGLRLLLTGPVRTLTLGGTGTVTASVQVAEQPRTADDVPPGPFRQRLAGLLDVRALLRFVEVTSTRTPATLRSGDGKITAAVAIHEGVAAAGTAVADLVVEVEELAGYGKQAATAAAALEAAGFERVDGDLVEVAAGAAGVDLTGFAVRVGVPLEPSLTAIDGYRAVFANLRDAIVVNWDGTVDDIDPEFLHDLRVAVRRTRSILANARRVLPDTIRDWAREAFGWFGDITGPPRDLDVYAIEWPQYVAALDDRAVKALDPLHERLLRMRGEAHAELAAHLRGERATSVVERWSAWLDAPTGDPLPDRAGRPLADVVERRIRRAHRVMVERGRTIVPTTPTEVVHELRKDAKRLRYLLECFGGLYEPAARNAFVARLKDLQGVLGEHQDTEVHAAQLRELAGTPIVGATTDTMIATGQLVERFEQRRAASRAAIEERFAKFDAAKTIRALDGLLTSARA